jgi:ribonuclease Z
MLICEAMNVEQITQIIAFLKSAGRDRDAGMLSDVPSYHIGTLEIAQLAQKAGVGEVVLSHIIPPTPNDSERELAYVAGMSDFYQGRIRIARDMQRLPVSPRAKS